MTAPDPVASHASASAAAGIPRVTALILRRDAVIIGILYVVFAVVMTQLRLLDTLGYESALVFGLLAAWLGGALPLLASRGGDSVRDARHIPPSASAPSASPAWDVLAGVLRGWLRLSAAGALLLLPPVAVLTANAAFVRNCAPLEGALFWLLIPFATVLFTSALALFLRTVFGRRAGWIYFLILTLLLVQPFVQIFTRPQIYAYNHVFGMFLGLSWDQTQPPFLTLLLYRCSTLAYAGMLLAAAAALAGPGYGNGTDGRKEASARGGILRAVRGGSGALFFVSLVTALVFLYFSDEMGFTNSYPHLHAALGAEFRAGDVRLVYDSAAVSAEEIRRIADEHQFQLEQVCAALGVRWRGTLTSYLYPSSGAKKRLLGTESSELARPWRKEIHVTADYWRAALRHEVVHVAAGSFGPYINRAPFIRVLGLTEGLAMAVEWSWGNRTLHEHAAAMLAQDMLPGARRCLSTAGFVTGASSVSYVASGSVTRWMIDTLGMEVVRRAYAQDDIEGVTGMRYEEIDRRWRAFLRGVPRQLPDSMATAYAFRRPSLFTAVCPRVVTERSRDAAEALAQFDAARALQLYRRLDQMAPNARAAFGIVSALYQRGAMDSVRQASGRYLRDASRAFSVFPLHLWRGAAAWAQDDSAAADDAFTVLVRAQPPGWPTELAARMRRVLRACPGDTAVRGVMLGALRRERDEDSLRELRASLLDARLRSDSGNAALLEEWVRLVSVDSTGRASALQRTGRFPVPAMHRALRMLTGGLHYRQGEWKKAERMFRSALEVSVTEMDRIDAAEWTARCAWQQRRARRESAQQQHVQ